jgi:transposase
MYENEFCEPWTKVIEDAEIVQLFGVSLTTIKRYIKQRREEGHVRPKAIPGRSPTKRAQVEASVLPQLQAHDDACAGYFGYPFQKMRRRWR